MNTNRSADFYVAEFALNLILLLAYCLLSWLFKLIFREEHTRGFLGRAVLIEYRLILDLCC